MVDFLKISTRPTKRGTIEIYPHFIVRNPSQDLMIRGGDFYAVWNEEKGLWSTSEQDVINIVDRELDKFAEENRSKMDASIKVSYMWDADSGSIDKWHKYCQRQMRDMFHPLDEKLIFSNSPVNKKDYASKRLEYPLEMGDTSAYDQLMSVLYSDEERQKLEWAIGAIVSGDSRELQKFVVLYGASGTGKSTILNIIQKLFKGYYGTFNAKALGRSNESFALESLKSRPLVGIQHDGDLSRIEDNTTLNSLVSHEEMPVNTKFEKIYTAAFKTFLFMGTNKPVKITDAKSGLIRRLIDVSPTGELIPAREYKKLMNQIEFELGPIAWKCRKIYEDNKDAYDNYIPVNMMGASNDFYNFVVDSYHIFKKEDGTTLTQSWAMYQEYCSESRVPYPLNKRAFKEELKNYFKEFKERFNLEDGTRVRSYYEGFRSEIFDDPYGKERKKEAPKTHEGWLTFDADISKSAFDKQFADCPAQLANQYGNPKLKWASVTTTLKDIDTKELHYMQGPPSLVTVDFDIPGEDGNKSFEKNIEAASKWPPTYAELSKSGAGIHLEYIFTGDPTTIDTMSEKLPEHVEIKIFKGNAALRRKLTKCNGLPIATISSGLPLKEKGANMVDMKGIRTEKRLVDLIERSLNKEFPPGSTKSSCDFIFKLLEDAYNEGFKYDVTPMRQSILDFAASSTHQADYCIKLVNKMKFKSEDMSPAAQSEMSQFIFFDIEVYPNLLLVNWKVQEDVDWEKVSKMNDDERLIYFRDLITNHKKKITRMINPSPEDIETLSKYKLAGYNCRRYDNHILLARMMGYEIPECYQLSQKIISGSKNCFFGQGYNFSEIDIYDMCSKKQSLKKYEIEYKFHHQEMGLDWNQPVPEELWEKVAEYCDNDVLATELVFWMRHADFTARQILADVAGMTINDTTNSLTTRIIFGTDRHPQSQFNYRFMGDVDDKELDTLVNKMDLDEDCTLFCDGKPIFPGYSFDHGVSTYRGEEVGEGGYVYSEPGMYYDVALLDIASMHPSSIEAEELFGPEYTKRFSEIKQARIAIKHKDFDKAKKMLGGKLAKYLDDPKAAKDLAQALKIAINSVYGLTSATFDNPFKDPRNIDNIVAKRGALFMVNLKHEVQKRGYTVAHIKTDSIKIPNADPAIIKFVTEYGKLYGYDFEHEATYDKMCLVNDAVYICYYDGHWSATGTQFQVPYVFKTCFTHEPIEFWDMCETKSVTSSLYLDMNEGMPDVSEYEKALSNWESKYKKGEISDLIFEKETAGLAEKIEAGHNYVFIGKVGLFCPMKDGYGAGKLLREKDGKMYAVTGTKGYKWLEAEMVQQMKKEDGIDIRYYANLVKEAVDTIEQFGNFESFVSYRKE